MKIYFVQVVDIWNNQTALGFYKDLDDAIDDINGFISEERYYLQKGDIQEYASTFEMCFDTFVRDALSHRMPELDNEEFDDIDDLDLMVRGYIFDSDEIINEISKLTGEA